MKRAFLLGAILGVFVLLSGVVTAPAQAVEPGWAAEQAGCDVPELPTNAAHPVLLVHGWNGKPLTDVQNELGRSLEKAAWTLSTFDYSASAHKWAADPAIADCLADHIVALSDASLAAGGDGLVYLVGHSMGGLAARFAAAQTRGDRLVATRIGGLVTLATPHTGSPWGDTPLSTIADAFRGHPRLPNPWATTRPDVLASHCLAVHDQGRGLPSGCVPPPYIDRSVPIAQVTSKVVVKRTIFSFHMYDIHLGGDSIVGVESSGGYPGSAEGGIQAVRGTRVTLTDVGCSVTLDQVLKTVLQLGAAVIGPKIGKLAAGFNSDSAALDALLEGKASPALLQFLALANVGSPCGHVPMTTFRPTVDAAAEALRGFAAARAVPTATAEVSTVTPDGRARADLTITSVAEPATCLAASLATGDGHALRCFAANFVHDPCWAEAGAATVVCLGAPWDTEAKRLTVDEPFESPGEDSTDRSYPWALELAGGTRCVIVQGAHDNFGDRVVDYVCDHNVVTLRDVDQRQQSWRVDLARYREGSGYTALGSNQVVRAWYGESGPGGPAARPAPKKIDRKAFLGEFLKAWWEGRTADLPRYATPAALAGFTAQPSGWDGYQIGVICGPDSDSCIFVLISGEAGLNYEASFEQRGDQLTITRFDFLGGGA